MTRHVRVPRPVVDKIDAGLIRPPMIVHHRGDRIPVFAEADLAAVNGGPLTDSGPGVLLLTTAVTP